MTTKERGRAEFTQGCGVMLAALAIILVALVWWGTTREPGAITWARRFGQEFRKAIGDEQVRAWAKHIYESTPPTEYFADIRVEELPPEVQRLLERRYPRITLHFTSDKRPTGITIVCGDEGIVIPFEEVLPMRGYYCILQIGEGCPYFAIYDYR